MSTVPFYASMDIGRRIPKYAVSQNDPNLKRYSWKILRIDFDNVLAELFKRL